MIATASRPETRHWCKLLGADVVIDHTKPLEEEFKKFDLSPVDYAFNCYSMGVVSSIVSVMAPRAHLGIITPDADLPQPVLISLMMKRITLSIEIMFSRAALGYEQQAQGDILANVAQLIQDGKLKPISNKQFNGFESLTDVETLQTSGKAIGKIVVKLI